MQLHIEKMEEKHTGLVLDIEKASFPSPWTRSMFVQEAALDYSNSYVLIVNKELAAYICSWTVLDEVTINKIACRSCYRRRGYSTMLLQHHVYKVCGNAVKSLLIEVRTSNNIAMAFYKKSGFIQTGIRKDYYSDTNENAILMSLDIDNFVCQN